jgi:uncharacterized damage-inducible protein DinB
MSLGQSLLPEFDHEMAGTRKTLGRVPEDRLFWTPHEKSMTLGGLASHLANLPSWVGYTIERDSLDVAPVGQPPLRQPQMTSRQALLDHFDRHVAEGRTLLASAPDDRLLAPWTLLGGGRAHFTLPRIAVLRGFVMNHSVHHRAQLTVYLRLLDVPVPGLYGPSADER